MSPRGLPSGTVTFLFTDVEGSTRLLGELGAEAYAEALAEHRRVIREACAAHEGIEVDTQGDAFFFAFPTAPGAIAAASALTESLAVGPIRVRVGIHTGTPLLGEEGYIGHDVHRAARIAASGHGGQVLVSSSTAALVETELRDLGEYRFKDLSAPERVHQLGAGDFPPLKTLHRTNLPIPATPFLGREAELAEVITALTKEQTRLLTLTGPGGTGKTRLAVQAAAEASEHFPDGVFWIPLAPLRDASLLDSTFAQALEVSEQPGIAIFDAIVSGLAAKRTLVVVDNCEHLVDAVADLVRRVVEGCPRLVVVASSRERLGLKAERVYAVPPMAPTDGELLFAERARVVVSDFESDEHVAEICKAVDGLPLAIELAAARTRSLSTHAIRERLGERLDLLATRDRDVEERQRTLEATIAWSYDLLDEEEQRVLRALSVFAGGCTLEAAEVVAGADLDLLESLLDKSLLRHRTDEAGQDRYWVLETIREFGFARLVESGEETDAVRQHADWCLALARTFEPDLVGSSRDALYLRLDADLANFRAALEGSAGSADEIQVAVPGLIWRYWAARDLIIEGQKWLESALAKQGGEPTTERERLLAGALWMAFERGEWDTAVCRADERLEVARALGEDLAVARALCMLGPMLAESGDPDRGLLVAQDAVAFCRSHPEAAPALFTAVHNLAVVWERMADGEQARETFREALAIADSAGDVESVATCHHGLAGAALLAGDTEDARTHIERALELWKERRVAQNFLDATLVGLAVVEHASGRVDRATLLLAAVERWGEETGRVLPAQHRKRFETVLARLHEELATPDFAAFWTAGQRLGLDETVDLALGTGAPAADRVPSTTDMSLQDRPTM